MSIFSWAGADQRGSHVTGTAEDLEVDLLTFTFQWIGSKLDDDATVFSCAFLILSTS